MIVKSFGCSFIFGNELHDDGYGTQFATPSNFTWPALTAKHLNAEYQCYACPGSGNTRIAESVLNQIQTGEPAYYIIGWTWNERFDFIERDGDRWRTITAWDNDSVAEFYYRNLHSQYLDKLNSLSAIALTLQNLQKINAKFTMTYMDDLLFEQQYHLSPAMQFMQNQIRPYLNNFDGMNFLDWSLRQGFPVGQRGNHPLEQAHQAAAEYMLNHNLV